MPLPSFFQRKPKAPADERRVAPAAGDDSPEVQEARVRARRRLIGAVVLLGLGIVGFPLLFETAPRPIPVDIPIEIPRKDGMPPLVAPPAAGSLPRASDAIITELPSDAGTEVPAASASAAAGRASGPVAATPASAAAKATAAPARASAAAAATVTPPKADDGARAKALLDGAGPVARPASAAVAASGASAPGLAGRFVVQVGAYTDATALREARQKVEKLGLKTYTQVIETESGKRTRVRVGPFATRDEADAAGRLLKGGGLPANILAL